jgi:hypothetical protein
VDTTLVCQCNQMVHAGTQSSGSNETSVIPYSVPRTLNDVEQKIINSRRANQSIASRTVFSVISARGTQDESRQSISNRSRIRAHRMLQIRMLPMSQCLGALPEMKNKREQRSRPLCDKSFTRGSRCSLFPVHCSRPALNSQVKRKEKQFYSFVSEIR